MCVCVCVCVRTFCLRCLLISKQIRNRSFSNFAVLNLCNKKYEYEKVQNFFSVYLSDYYFWQKKYCKFTLPIPFF